MNNRVAVTGMGIVSALGIGAEKNYNSLISGISPIDYPEILSTIHTKLPVGEVKITNESLAEMLGLSKEHSFTRAALLGSLAVKEAIDQAGLQPLDLKTTGFISGTSVGGMDSTEQFYHQFKEKPELRRFIEAQHPGFTTSQIAGYFGIRGLTGTVSTACSSAANAIMTGTRLIKSGKLKRVIVGGTDCLTKFTINGFNSLMILSSEKCKPFDKDRKGLNLGEGAAYLVLEAEDVIGKKTVLSYVAGFGNANDAFHQTASSENGEGAFLAMKKALDTAAIKPKAIDYINAHGTATQNNDLSESVAVKRIFGNELPDFSSTKAFTGHCLGAAGGIEAVFSILSLQKNKIFPNLNFTTLMPETGIRPVTQCKAAELEVVLSNSFGFGGNCTSLIFSKNEE